MTILELMDPVSRRAHKPIDDATDDDYADVLAVVRLAIRYLQGAEDWPCHYDTWELSDSTTPALADGTYEYDMRTLNSDFRKLQGNSICASSAGPLEFVNEVEEIDRRIQATWKLSSTTAGTPRYCSMMGQKLILAPKPNAAWAAANTVYGYYFKAEALTDVNATLLMYEDFFNDAVELALIFMLQQNDDPNFRALLSHWEQSRLQELRSYDPTPQSSQQVRTPPLGVAFGGDGVI